MPEPISTGALVGLGIAGNLINGAGSFFGQKSANETNVKLAREGQAFEQKMWEQNNAYNSPIEQMKRFQAAGLNPNLIYGQGNAGNAVSMPHAQVPVVRNTLENINAPNVPQVLSMYQDFKMKEATINQTDENTKYIEQKRLNESIQNQLLNLGVIGKSLDNKQKSAIMNSQIEMYKIQNQKLANEVAQGSYQLNSMNPLQREKLINEIGLQGLDSQLKNADLKLRGADLNLKNLELNRNSLDYEMNKGLKPYGLSMQDAYWQRLLGIIFGKFEKFTSPSNSGAWNPKNLLKNFFEGQIGAPVGSMFGY